MLEINQLSISIGDKLLFSPINLVIELNTITVLMGSSGIGKTSILSAIGGFIEYNGTITVGEHFTVFQDSHQLFPWFTIRKNLDLVCKIPYENIIHDWKLDNLLDRYPNEISGGQRQRITLIRAICSGADILLCDEPLSGLDAVTRYFVINDFKNTLSRLKISALFITHDLHEAQQISDNILLLTKNGLVKLPKGINETDFIAQISH